MRRLESSLEAVTFVFPDKASLRLTYHILNKIRQNSLSLFLSRFRGVESTSFYETTLSIGRLSRRRLSSPQETDEIPLSSLVENVD